eukprot:s1893_g7.t1
MSIFTRIAKHLCHSAQMLPLLPSQFLDPSSDEIFFAGLVHVLQSHSRSRAPWAQPDSFLKGNKGSCNWKRIRPTDVLHLLETLQAVGMLSTGGVVCTDSYATAMRQLCHALHLFAHVSAKSFMGDTAPVLVLSGLNFFRADRGLGVQKSIVLSCGKLSLNLCVLSSIDVCSAAADQICPHSPNGCRQPFHFHVGRKGFIADITVDV